jgi:hypothetical protein
MKVIQHDIVEDPDAWSRYLQRPEERLSIDLIYGTLQLQTGGWAVYAPIYKEMFFRSHGKIPSWGPASGKVVRRNAQDLVRH